MKHHRLLSALVPVVAVGAASAQTMKLDPIPSGVTKKVGFYMPHQLQLSSSKPDGIKKAPSGLQSPMYGVLTMQGKAIFVIVDRPSSGDAKLYVDSNGDGDLTNDPSATWTSHPNQGRDGKTYSTFIGTATVNLQLGGKEIPASIGVYVFDPNDSSRPQLKDKLLYYADYGYEGDIKLGGNPYHVMLVDTGANGDFKADQRGGPNAPPGELFMIDVNGNHKFDRRGEQYSASDPFNIKGTTYEIANMSVDGGSFDIVKSAKTVAEILPPPDLGAGSKAVAFKATTTDGKAVSFPDGYKGKVVMLDFWATWCGPCMAEVPNVVNAYQKYHSKGFEILGISLDNAQTQKDIAKVTADKGMTWQQVSDGKFWNAAVAQLYVVQAIPQAYLIDGDTGEILAEGEDIRGEGLEKAIEAAFAKKGRSGSSGK